MFINFFGIVTETFQDNTAEVIIGKPSGKGDPVIEAKKSKKMRVIATNPVYAREGDLVSLTIRRLVTKEEIFFTYIFPIILFFIPFVSLRYMMPSLMRTNIPFLVGLIGIALGVVVYSIKKKNFSTTFKGKIKAVRTMSDLDKYKKYKI